MLQKLMLTSRLSALSLRARLAGMMSFLFLLGMILLYLAAQSSAVAASNRSFDRLLMGSMLSIAETLSVSDGVVQVDLPYAALDMLSAAPEDRVFYHVIGPASEVVTGNSDLPLPPGFSLDRRGVAADWSEPRFFDASYSGEKVRFAVLGRELAQPGVTGWLWVQVGQTRRARDELTNELVLHALAPIVAMTLLALAVVWFGIRRALTPLTRLGDELKARGPSDLHLITAPVPAEAAPLIDSLNEFMSRLERNIEALRAFIADAAHQMRTPLAAMLAQAQVAADGDQEDLRRGLKAVQRNGTQLTRLLNQLLSHATVTHRADVLNFKEFDLLRVVRMAVRESVPMALDLGLRIESPLATAPFRGDPLMIGEAVKNVVDNAFRHARAAEGGLSIGLTREDQVYVIAISDSGGGVSPLERERVFDRFARGDTLVPGSGLGMAIVRKAVLSHGGSVQLDDRPGGGLIVRLRLPEISL